MTFSKSRRFARATVLSACVAVAGFAAVPSMAQAKSFSCGDLPTSKTPSGLNGGYITNIRVTGSYSKKSSACKAGNSLALAYYKCRRAKGVKGSCAGQTVNGLKCSEKRGEEIATEYSATVTCKKGAKKIVHTYQQNLT